MRSATKRSSSPPAFPIGCSIGRSARSPARKTNLPFPALCSNSGARLKISTRRTAGCSIVAGSSVSFRWATGCAITLASTSRPRVISTRSCRRCTGGRTSCSRTMPRSSRRSSTCGPSWIGSSNTSTSPAGWIPHSMLASRRCRSRILSGRRRCARTASSTFAKTQDLATQLAVSAQGYLALELVRKNNLELVKGVDRATTTTVSALRTAVMTAQGLVNQKLVLDQIGALNETTADMIEGTSAMLRQQSAGVHEQAASATVSIEKLQAAFANIYATIDTIDASKLQALETMRQTIDALSREVARAQTYLERAHEAPTGELASIPEELKLPVRTP